MCSRSHRFVAIKLLFIAYFEASLARGTYSAHYDLIAGLKESLQQHLRHLHDIFALQYSKYISYFMGKTFRYKVEKETIEY